MLNLSNSKLFFLFILLNLILKCIFISFWDIALDEPFTIFYAQQNFDEIFEMLKSENNPPLHFILLHYTIKLFGIGSFAMRLPSVIFSSITAGVIFLIGSKFFSKIVAVFAAMLYTFSTMQIFFAHEARVYPIMCLLAALSILFFFLIKENPKKNINYIFLVLVNTALLYAHYFGFFVVFAQIFSFIFFFENKKEYTVKLLITLGAILLLYAPILNIFIERMLYSTENGTWVQRPGFSELWGNVNRFLNNRNVTFYLKVFIAIQLYYIAINNQLKTYLDGVTKNTNNRILLTFFALPYLLMFVLSYKVPMFIDRYILFTSIPLYICIAVVIDSINNKTKIYYSLLTLLFVVQLVFFNLKPDNNRRIKEVVETVKALKQNPETKVYLAPHYADLSFAYHYNQDIFKDYTNFKQRLESENIYGLESAEVLERETNPTTQNIIFVECGSEFIDPNHNILKYFTSHYNLKSKKHIFEIYIVYEFVKK
jgi:uncharacterized membrane protein